MTGTIMRVGRRLGAATLAGLLFATCATPTPVQPVLEMPIDGLRYRCDVFEFGADVLSRAGNEETAAGMVGAALRIAIRSSDLPAEGWIEIGRSATEVEFLNGGQGEIRQLLLALEPSGWRIAGSGFCRPEVVLPNPLGSAEWRLDGEEELPGPEAVSFVAQVTELACNSGEPADGRIVGPFIASDSERVLVFFGIQPRTDQAVATCPRHPSTPVLVGLPEALGDRQLLDGGTLPFADPGPE